MSRARWWPLSAAGGAPGPAIALIGAALSLAGAGPGGAQGFLEPPPLPQGPHSLAGSPAPRVGTVPLPSSVPLTRYEPQSQAQTKPMRVEVIDGRSFRDIESDAVYRLWGIDVCGADQTALLGRQPWPCGTMARAWLVTATLGKWVSCNVLDTTRGVSSVRCSSSNFPDLALAMLREGQAVTLPQDREPKQVKAYLAAQESARKAFRGLWGSAYDMPWVHRAKSVPAVAITPDSVAAPVDPTQSPSPKGLDGDQPIQREGTNPKAPGLTRGLSTQ